MQPCRRVADAGLARAPSHMTLPAAHLPCVAPATSHQLPVTSHQLTVCARRFVLNRRHAQLFVDDRDIDARFHGCLVRMDTVNWRARQE